jgi:hypothetical protein
MAASDVYLNVLAANTSQTMLLGNLGKTTYYTSTLQEAKEQSSFSPEFVIVSRIIDNILCQ